MLVCSGAVAAMSVAAKPFQLLLLPGAHRDSLELRLLVSVHASLPSISRRRFPVIALSAAS